MAKRGENGHAEAGWDSSMFEDALSQLFFQLTRGTDSKLAVSQYGKLCKAAFNVNESQVALLLSLMVQTRDSSEGKKETKLFYGMLEVWDGLAHQTGKLPGPLLRLLPQLIGGAFEGKPYGSFRDVKYFIDYVVEERKWARHDLLTNASQCPVICLVLDLVHDKLACDEGSDAPSLLAKWLPREKSRFGYQAPLFAMLGKDYLSWEQMTSGTRSRVLSEYRRRIASINRELATTQVLQCGKKWSNIDFERGVTSSTMRRQAKAFSLCGRKKEEALLPGDLDDRLRCKENFESYINCCKGGTSEMKVKDVTLGELVKAAWSLDSFDEDGERDRLDISYRAKLDEVQKLGGIGKFCVMCDTSASMSWENAPLHDAVGIAMMIAETSSVCPGIMTFATDPTWIKLDGEADFVTKVKTIRQSQLYAGASTDIYKCFRLVLAAIQEKCLSQEEVSSLNILVLSDMQINAAVGRSIDTLDLELDRLFERAGYPCKPKLVYWNMRSTSGFPTADYRRERIMLVSGYEVGTLQALLTDGVSGLEKATPVSSLLALLAQPRYSWFY